MKRYTLSLGAILSGLCLFFAALHAVFFLAWIALVPLLLVASPSPFRAGLIMGATLSSCAFAWMIPGVHSFSGSSFASGIALFLGCVTIFSFGCAFMLWLAFRWSRWPGAIYFASLWVVAETLLQWAAGGLPWFLFHLGNALSANLYAIQPVSVIGVTGLGMVVVFINCHIATAIAGRSWKKLLLPFSLFVAYMCWGWLLLRSFDNPVGTTGGSRPFKISILQENIPPEMQWDQDNGNILVNQLLEQERQSIAQHPDLILWSESAIPWTYAPNDDLVRELLQQSDSAGITHILGMNTAVAQDVVGNSAYCLLPGGKVAGRYDKRTPLLLIEESWHGLLMPFFSANGYSVMPGKSDIPLQTPFGKAGVLICNESALPGAAASSVSHGAQFLFNLSNDGWFRDTYLVTSHFYNARLRAVETRKDLAINSNNGRSGLIKASGAIEDASFFTIHPNDIQTIAVRCPGLPFYIALLSLLIIFIIHQKTKSP